jgi:hypothetical protein
MSENGQLRTGASDAEILRWSGRVLAAEDLRRCLNGHREIVLGSRAIVTPLALEELRQSGITLTRQAVSTTPPAPAARWGYLQDRPHAGVESAVQSLRRDGLAFAAVSAPAESLPCRWAHAVARCISRGECRGGVVFCQDPGLVCCVANKVAGIRAAAVLTVSQAARAALTLGANLLAVEMPGRTFFEIRQILRAVGAASETNCPPGVACTLQELDGHAHR